ncbi:geranylgeranylglyceryl/heptaprenylglyceryl phosphate synthase [Ichthyenterobacterium sp. W332]|uniref:Geranylgeranylglyceryl phosphate synthase n=1 Tax=Microcosmobacter mediterraneus TaxID=3075607 RepID=A0ABU2YJ81_9FLAO|nr:geranylgeranylglyceryl/heptaprenylglyceryl phosphate synthase [Ichthyenterobacterium sp. W332]MDT0558230.1 geranylgeranylglyceryl/heptaprenylglyceryl phosphate synthase [Ichthyenterobacterium sp. W332]
MSKLLQYIINAKKEDKKLLAVLIDPDKIELKNISNVVNKVNRSVVTHIFVGGSEVATGLTELVVNEIKKHTKLPVILFPGDTIQITNKADGLLFLSLISGRNAEYLIGKHVEAASKLSDTKLEVIPTGYILIENGKQTAVERVSETKPLQRNNIDLIIDTAKAGELLGMQLIYLEAGSGATQPIEGSIISKVKQHLNIPLIVGGGIRSKKQLQDAYDAGADLVVIGTAFENDELFFDTLS